MSAAPVYTSPTGPSTTSDDGAVFFWRWIETLDEVVDYLRSTKPIGDKPGELDSTVIDRPALDVEADR